MTGHTSRIRFARSLLSAFSNRTRNGRSARRAAPQLLVLAVGVFALLCSIGAIASAESISKQQMQSLDEQVQEVKSDVLGIAAELNGLEEKLLYPSNTQVAVFVSLAEGDTLRLDSVEIQIDGELVAHHIYSLKELEALRKGGVQRIYTGNVATGEHRIDVVAKGKLQSGKDWESSNGFAFQKQVEPKLVGIALAGQDSNEASIQLGGL